MTPDSPGRKHIAFVEASDTGAGEASIEYASSCGYRTTVFTRSPEVWGRRAHAVQCDTNEAEALLAAVAQVDCHTRIDGITTTADFYVFHAALAARSLGLPGPAPQAIADAANKYLMRRALRRAGRSDLNPYFTLIGSPAEAEAKADRLDYPLVAKPQDANNSWNVVQIFTPGELIAYCREAAAWSLNDVGQPLAPGVLIEGYVEGPEYSVEVVRRPGGTSDLLAVVKKSSHRATGSPFADFGDELPIRGSVADRLFEAVRGALEALHLDTGVFHTECRVDGSGVKVIEVNPRLAGDMLGSHLIELALGDSPVRQLVEIALGSDVRWHPTLERGAGDFGVCMPRTGVYRGIANLDEMTSLPGVEIVRQMSETGAVRHWPPCSNADFVARVVAVGDSPEQAGARAREAAEAADVIVEDVSGDRITAAGRPRSAHA